MKTDIFTKVLLAIIALNLSILVLSKLEIVPKAHAQSDTGHFQDNAASGYGLVPLNDDGTISVRIDDVDEYALLNVNLKYVDMYRTQGTIDVDISKPIGVEVKNEELEVVVTNNQSGGTFDVWCRNCD